MLFGISSSMNNLAKTDADSHAMETRRFTCTSLGTSSGLDSYCALRATVSDKRRWWKRTGPKLRLVAAYFGTTAAATSASMDSSLLINCWGSTLFQIPRNPRQSASKKAPSSILGVYAKCAPDAWCCCSGAVPYQTAALVSLVPTQAYGSSPLDPRHRISTWKGPRCFKIPKAQRTSEHAAAVSATLGCLRQRDQRPGFG